MGVPLLAGLALTAAGTGLQMSAAEQEKSRMNTAASNELARQQQYRQQSQGQFAQSLQQSQPKAVQSQLQQGQAKTAEALAATQAFPLSTASSSVQAPASRITEDVGTQAFNRQSNLANAALGGYDEFNLQQAIKNLRAQQQQGLISSQAAASQQVLPLELQAAQNSAAGLAGAGSLVSTLGSLASLYGASQAGAAGRAAYNPYGIQNWAALAPAVQRSYGQAYQYYNAPGSPGYVNPYTNPYQ